MNEPLHILINDETGDPDSKHSVFRFFDVLKKDFVQVKDANQFDYLIAALPPSREVTIWVHPNASAKKFDNLPTTPGEASINAMCSRNIEFNVISRYPNDVSQELLNRIGKTALPLSNLVDEIKSAKTTTVASIQRTLASGTNPIEHVADHGLDSQVDVAIICALYEDEFESIREFLEDTQPVPGFSSMVVGSLKGTTKRVVVDFQTRMGMVEAAYLSTQIVNMFSPKYLIMVGVCGGRFKKGVRLLDILVPSKVFDFQTGKYEQGEFKPYMREGNIGNKGVLAASSEILRKMYDYVPHPFKEKCKGVKIRSRAMACGNVVVKTDGYLEDHISRFDEETEGVEMESYGVVRVTELMEGKHVKPIIIKAVMDYTEKDKKDNDKPGAAYFSACFTYFFVKDHLLI